MIDLEMIPTDSAAVMRSEARSERRDQVRARANAAVPASYSPWFHLLFPSLCGLGIVVACALAMRDVHLWQLAFIPVAFVVVNLAEWVIHRDLLHKRTRGFTLLYDRHTPMHHVVFVT